jgi:hypothetical protein
MAENWQVEWQEPKPDLRPGGHFVQVVEVHYVVTQGPATGHRDSVVVEQQNYRPDFIQAAIDAKVAHNNAIAGL